MTSPEPRHAKSSPRCVASATRRSTVRNSTYTLQTAADLGGRLEDLAQFDLPNEEIDRHLERVAATTVDDLSAAARNHLDPEALRIVAVGPAAILVPQLQELGEVAVIEVAL
jgi:predicted Zn-dependent peptidase